MVPCLHQSNVYMKRKLRAWRVQKCISLVSARMSLTCAGLETTPFHVSQYRAKNGNLRKTGYTFSQCTIFAPKQCLYQKEATGMESPKIYSFVGGKTSITCAGLQTTPSHVSQYRAENGNLRKSGSTFSNGTVFAPKQRLYQNETMGMESPKMYSSHRCKNLTYLRGTASNQVSCK